MDLQAVIFDLDGTLLDTVQDLADSVNAVLERLGMPAHDPEHYKALLRDGTYALMERALPQRHRNRGTVEKGVALMREEYGRRWGEKTRPYEGVPEMLDALSAQGIKKAVLSNKLHEFTGLMVPALLPEWKFARVMGVGPSVPKKPDPTAALEIAAAFDLRPEEVMFLGDMNTDMKTAKAAGMFPVGALWGFRDAEDLREAGAEVLVENPQKVVDFF